MLDYDPASQVFIHKKKRRSRINPESILNLVQDKAQDRARDDGSFCHAGLDSASPFLIPHETGDPVSSTG